MSITAIEQSAKQMLTAADVAPVLGVNPQSLRMQAQKDVRQLGFPATCIGNRLLIPKPGFIAWFKGGGNT